MTWRDPEFFASPAGNVAASVIGPVFRRGDDDPITARMWFSDDADRVPLRIEADTGCDETAPTDLARSPLRRSCRLPEFADGRVTQLRYKFVHASNQSETSSR